MEQGEIKEHPMEAVAVRRIFCRHLAGASYAALVEHLRDTGPAYDGDKLWNKNMVARILENSKYIGGSGFPAVIPPETYQKTLTQRKERAAPPTKTPAQKELRRLCGGNPPKYVDGQVLDVLNRLAANPSLIRTLDPPEDEPVQIRVLHRKLTDLLKKAPVDEAAARRTALDLAAQRLDAIGSEEYETERLRRVFEKTAPMESLDAELLRNCIQAITIQKHHAIVQLKNGQTVE